MRSAGSRRTCTVASQMTPRRPFAAEHHLAHARAGRGVRHRAGDEQPGGRDDPQPARRVGDVAVAVGLHARRARRDPAAERRVRERVGVVPEGPALGVELLLQPRAVDAGLHAREPRGGVDVDEPVHALEVDGDHRPRLVARRLEAAGDARAAAERDHHGVGVERRAQDLASPRPRCPGARRRRGRGRGRRGAGGRGRAGSCRARGRRGRARRRRRGRRRPRARARRAARRRAAARGSSRSSKAVGCVLVCPTSTPRCCLMKGPKAGLSSCEKATPSSPQPHHFIAVVAAGRVAVALMAPTLPSSGWDSNPQPFG